MTAYQKLTKLVTSSSCGSQAPGSASASVSINYAFSQAVTPTISTRVNGASSSAGASATGSTCASGTAYTAGGSCVLNLTLTQSKVGNRTGAIVFASASGTILGETPVGGIGNAPGLVLDPAVQATFSFRPSSVRWHSSGTTPRALPILKRPFRVYETPGSFVERTNF
jgi:hypothetical protein